MNIYEESHFFSFLRTCFLIKKYFYKIFLLVKYERIEKYFSPYRTRTYNPLQFPLYEGEKIVS